MRVSVFKKCLIVLALVMGQWLSFWHAFQHPALGAADQLCQICVHAQGLDSGAITPSPTTLSFYAPERAKTPIRSIDLPCVSASHPPIRGPPTHLA